MRFTFWRVLAGVVVGCLVGGYLLPPPEVRATNLSAGGAAPGGSSGQLQYNNAGTLGGVTGLTTSAGTFTGSTVRTTFGTAADGANTIDFNETDGCLTFEGATANSIEMRFCANDPTSGDQRINLPNLGVGQTHTMPTLEGQQTFSAPNTFSGALTAANANGARLAPLSLPITTSTTTSLSLSWTLYTNQGASGATTYTLENNPGVAGAFWQFAVVAAQTMTISPSAGESLYFGTDQCVVSLTSNSVGSYIEIGAVTTGSGAAFFTKSYVGSWTCNDV